MIVGVGYVEVQSYSGQDLPRETGNFPNHKIKIFLNFIYSLINLPEIFLNAQILLYPSPFSQKISLLQFCLCLCEICSLILSPLFLVIGNSDISNSAELDHRVPYEVEFMFFCLLCLISLC